MQNRLVRSRGNTLDLVTCALRIEITENPKLSLLYTLLLWSVAEGKIVMVMMEWGNTEDSATDFLAHASRLRMLLPTR